MKKTINLSRDVQRFNDDLKKQNAKPLYELTAGEARIFLINLQRETHKDINGVIVEDKAIFTQDAGSIDLRIVRPDTNEKLPVILYIHGGGWILGNKETHDMLIKNLSLKTNSAVIFPEYSLSPEVHFPVAIEQIYSGLKYIYDNPEEFNIDNSKIVLAGDSAGGNMAVAVALKSKYDNGPKIIYQILLYPVTDFDMKTGSYEEFKDGPWLTKKAMEWFSEAYIQNKSEKSDIYASPLKANVENLKDLPSTLIITAENDVLRDEGELLADKLDNAGVDVLSIRINGTHHDFMMLNALFNSNQTKICFDIIGSCLKNIYN